MKPIILISLCLLTLTSACARRETPVAVGNRDQILQLGNLSEPQDLDPHTVTGVQEHRILYALLEGLVQINPQTLEPMPGVAERWDVSTDGLTFTFHLRPEARWSNGDALTAEDFCFSFRRILSPNLAAPYAYMLFVLKGAEDFNHGTTTNFDSVGAKSLDPHTLEVTLKEPAPYFLSLLNHNSWYPVHPPTILKVGAIDQIGTSWTKPETYVGNGPFTLASWAPGDQIVVRKSTTYWDHENVRLNEIHFHAIGDNNIEERAFRAGQLHITAAIPLDRIAYYREHNPELMHLDPYLGTYTYLLNVTRPPLNDARVRRALSMAVDRDRLVRFVTLGGETPANAFTPPDTAGFSARTSLPTDPAAAQKLLAEAGFPGGQNFPKLQLLYNTSDAHARISQAIQQMWKETLGIEVELVNMEWKVYVAQTQEKRYDIARWGWIGDYNDPKTFLDIWTTGGGNNRAGWSNAEYDQLIAEADRTPDPESRREVFQRAEAILSQEMPIIPLYFYKSKSLVAPSVHGWYPNILDQHPYNRVYLEP